MKEGYAGIGVPEPRETDGEEAAERVLAADAEEMHEVFGETLERMYVHDRLMTEILTGRPGDGSWRDALVRPEPPEWLRAGKGGHDWHDGRD